MSRPRAAGLLNRAAVVGSITAGLVLLSTIAPQSHVAQGWIVDLTAAVRVWISGPQPLHSDKVLIVAVDEESLDDPSLLGTPRALFTPVWAELAETALAHGATRILFDFVIQYDAARLEIDGATPLRRYDIPFLTILRREARTGRVVIGRSDRATPGVRFAKTAGPQGIGLVDLPYGSDNAIRLVPTTLTDRSGGTWRTLTGHAAPGRDMPVPVIPPARLDTLPAVPLAGLLKCKNDAALEALFAGRTVFVGSTMPGEDRLRAADRLIVTWGATGTGPDMPCGLAPPVVRVGSDRSLPGVYVHAAAADAALSGWAPTRVSDVVRLGSVAAGAAAGAAAGILMAPLAGLGALVLLLIATVLGMAIALDWGLLLWSADPLLAVPLAFGLAWGARSFLLDQEGRALSRQFGRYLSPVLIERMRDAAPELGGERRDVTVMFADLSGFTSLSENRDSEEIMEVLNRYLELIAREITAADGYVDKFVGDAVMAIWNAPAPVPDHAAKAIAAGFRVADAVKRQTAIDRAAGQPGFSIKIGINSGPVTVGNIGSEDRLNYTVIGEAVNVAARLESLPKDFETDIIVGPDTAAAASQAFDLLEIVDMRVTGREAPVRISIPLGPVGSAAEWSAETDRFGKALAAFQSADFETAEALWADLGDRVWPGAGPSRALALQALRMSAQPTPWSWQGVLTRVGK